MALFQTPPTRPEDLERCKPLATGPDQVLEMDEARWYAEVYRGDDVPQLTVRAVIVGSLLGFLLAFTNLYIGLKTGWALGVAITASILAFALWRVALAVGIARTPMTILETNCMQSTASSAGYATGGTMVSAISALLILSATPERPGGEHLPWPVLVLWTLALAALGTCIAIPMKRSMINRDRLKFPSGTAAAVTLQSLYSEGQEAIRKARALAVAAVVSAVFPLLLELKAPKLAALVGRKDDGTLLPADLPIFNFLGLPARGTHLVDGKAVPNTPSDWTLTFDLNPVMIAAGVLVGLRVATWMTIGGLLLAYVLGPMAYEAEWTNTAGQVVRAASQPWKAWREIGIWFGVPILVASGLVAFATQLPALGRAVSSLIAGRGGDDDPRVAATEVPLRWFIVGTLLSGSAVVAIAAIEFSVPVLYGILAVLLTFVLSLVACRATGESDITPVGAMGKLMQLTYGVLIPQSTTANLMTASITASSAGSAADLLNDLKSGYLLGANPRRQFVAQFLGIFAGTAATVMGFYLLVPDATVMTGSQGVTPAFPAPSAQAWKAVAEVFKTGLANMHPMHQEAMGWGLGLGTLLGVLELPQVPAVARRWLPSATGLGLGFILPFQYPLAMLIGAVGAEVWTRADGKGAEAFSVPVSAGVIAGVSLMGVLVALFNNFAA